MKPKDCNLILKNIRKVYQSESKNVVALDNMSLSI